ncbi:MAG: hypothetical protein J6T51_05435 [Kiritimatiellae bacterium]|nr:hypothetical protein [Kiritimatiellia bacterium]
MKFRSDRGGSALLIVLGMLSFMVVSAVGFSVYMRASRAPSSYLRRNVAARYLVKAALAKAIGELEGDVNTDSNWGHVGRLYGIYDDPYPGIVVGDTSVSPSGITDNLNGDYWAGRVFTPFGSADRDDTVPTLTLEALAYLPPAIINDVRYFSRRTRTAKWRRLPYDAGHYAYCAVNVSDLFDVNRLRADVPRDSGANRITLTSLCTTTFQGTPSYTGELDDVLDKGKTIPFTSLADFNFVAGAGSSQFAPFMNSVFGSRSGQFNPVNSLFITDTWFPPTNTTGATVYDLASNAQPFKDFSADCFLNTLLKLNPEASELYTKNLGIGVAALYDYLDSDSKPISLVLPTVEAVPMVAGVGSPIGLAPTIGPIGDPPQPDTVPNISGTAMDSSGNTVPVSTIVAKRTCQLFGITSFGNRVHVPVVTTCPFKRLKTEDRAKSYTVRGLLRVWLAPDGMGCRPATKDNLYPEKAGDWSNPKKVKNGVATFLSDPKTLSDFDRDIKTTQDAVAELTLVFSDLDVQMPIYYNVAEAVDESATRSALPGYTGFLPSPGNFKASYKSFGDLKSRDEALRPLTADGEVNQTWRELVNKATFNRTQPYAATGGGGVTEFDPAATPVPAAGDCRLYAAVWVQVMDGDQVVDMVPACAKDDADWLGMNLPNPDSNLYNNWCGSGVPLLNFKSDAAVTYENINTTLAAPPAFTEWKALYTVDPRYNFAPEDWFSSKDSETATKSEWMRHLGLNGTSSQVLGRGGRDHDIFMFVSDQEYLQSIGELQFLPILEDMDGDGSFNSGGYSPNFNGKPFSDRTGPTSGNFANGDRFWKTYSAFPVGGVNNVNFKNPYEMVLDGKQVTVHSGVGDFRLNPYSQDDRVFLAAFLDTPFDYYVASDRDDQATVQNKVISKIETAKDGENYSFGDKCSVAKLSKGKVLDISDAIRERIEEKARSSGGGNWISAWDSLAWQELSTDKINDGNNTFVGETLDQNDDLLHGVDRKFLYSFWRECFDNRQQLFLIFVRAEPTSVGGGGIGRVSSQLGGRAVALVWRDPAKPNAGRPARSDVTMVKRNSKTCPPHRTRVLFYHQFD